MQLVDFAFLSFLTYMIPAEGNDLPTLIGLLLPHLNMKIVRLVKGHRPWMELELHRPSGKPLTVVAVSGTDPTNVLDILEDIRMWTEPVVLRIMNAVLPTSMIWPRETSSMVLGALHRAQLWLGVRDDQWHYTEILDYVRQIPAEREVLLTGHSLGGGIALVIGSLTGRTAIAIQPPGIYHSLTKHQVQNQEEEAPYGVHKKSVSLLFEGDLIEGFDKHGGLVQTMMCDSIASSIAVSCHLVEGAICHLLRHCGDKEGRFASCTHEYRPTATTLELARSVAATARQTLQSSSLIAGFKLSSVLYPGLLMTLACSAMLAVPYSERRRADSIDAVVTSDTERSE